MRDLCLTPEETALLAQVLPEVAYRARWLKSRVPGLVLDTGMVADLVELYGEGATRGL